MVRAHRSLLAVLAGVLSLPSGMVWAEAVALPVEQTVDARTIAIDLQGAQVDVRIEPGAESSIRIDDLYEGEDTEGFVLLGLESGRLSVGQPLGDESVAPPVSVAITVGGSERLVIEGQELVVRMVDVREELDQSERALLEEESMMEAAKARRPGGVASRFTINTRDSEITLERVRGGQSSGENNRLVLESCRGPFIFNEDHGTVEISDHWGSLHLRGKGTQFGVSGGEVIVDLLLDGGELRLAQGGGTVKGRVTGASVDAEEWAGGMRLEGSDSRFDIRLSGTEDDQLYIKGENQDINIKEHGGVLDLNLTAGRVSVEGVAGKVKLQARESTEIELQSLDQSVKLDLSEGATATVRDAEDKLQATVNGGEFHARALQSAVLRLTDTIASVREVTGKVKVEATDSQVDLELSVPRSRPELSLKGDSSGRVVLSSPCWVRLSGSAQDAGERVQANGCELLTRTANRRPNLALRGQPAPITLLADVGDDSHLEVWSK